MMTCVRLHMYANGYTTSVPVINQSIELSASTKPANHPAVTRGVGKRLYKGFTLTEMMLTLAIAGILLAIGVPSFSEVVRNGQISSQYNRIVGSLLLARSEAVKGPSQVTLCARRTVGVNECGDSDDWANGWLVFVDNTIAAGETEASIDSNDQILRVETALNTGYTTVVLGSATGSAAAATSASFIRYTTDGDTEWASASIMICDSERGPAKSRAINILLTGDVRRGRTPNDTDVPIDVFNRPISNHCPDSA
ncbi:MAG: GspH/FimT family pseudopilin [Granulosicoccus sp.]